MCVGLAIRRSLSSFVSLRPKRLCVCVCVCVCVLVLLYEGPCLVLSLSDRSGCVCVSLSVSDRALISLSSSWGFVISGVDSSAAFAERLRPPHSSRLQSDDALLHV